MLMPEPQSPAPDGHEKGPPTCSGGRGNARRDDWVAPPAPRPSNFLAGVIAGCGAIERSARLRALAALAGAMCRPRPLRLLASLRAAERDDRALLDADDELASIPTLTQRRLISAWAACL